MMIVVFSMVSAGWCLHDFDKGDKGMCNEKGKKIPRL